MKENAPQLGGGLNKDVEIVNEFQADLFFEELDFDKVVKKGRETGAFDGRLNGSRRYNMVRDSRQI